MKPTISAELQRLLLCWTLSVACATVLRLDSEILGEEPATLTAKPAEKLSVALYPYVPRLDQFKTAISNAWQEKHKNVQLEFVSWDCYSDDPPGNLDVFVFDAIFLDYFQSEGFLEPISDSEIEEREDILGYAREGTRIDGRIFGIPQLGCASILFYRRTDKALNDASTLSEVVAVIGTDTYTGVKPPVGTGLMVYLGGGTTNACHYLDAVEDIYSVYNPNPPLPREPARINDWAIINVQSLLSMASAEHAKHYDKPYERAAWFSQGLGRAFVGYTESMSSLSREARKGIAFKPLPLSDRKGVSLFYSDVAGVNSSVEDDRRELAVELANLVSSSDVILESIGPTSGYDYPQYLMPVRHSVFEKLKKMFPLYGQMYQMVQESDPRLFRIGPTSRQWLNSMKDKIRDRVFAGDL